MAEETENPFGLDQLDLPALCEDFGFNESLFATDAEESGSLNAFDNLQDDGLVGNDLQTGSNQPPSCSYPSSVALAFAEEGEGGDRKDADLMPPPPPPAYAKFRKPGLTVGGHTSPGYGNMYNKHNRAQSRSPTSPSASPNAVLSPGSATADKMGQLHLGQQQQQASYVYDSTRVFSNGGGHSNNHLLSPSGSGAASNASYHAAELMMQGHQGQQQARFMSNARAGDTSNYLVEVDANGDGLRPLHLLSPRPNTAHPPLMQRSMSSHALGQLRTSPPNAAAGNVMSALDPFRMGSPRSRMQPGLSDMQAGNLQTMVPPMRRVQSTGDIQSVESGLDCSGFDDGGYKIGKYTLEERKIRIMRYRQKRTERNFNKKIKYACRKTLADSRPRVRGRFAKNEDSEAPGTHNGSTQNGPLIYGGDEEEEEEDDMIFDEDSSGSISYILNPNSSKHRPQAPVQR